MKNHRICQNRRDAMTAEKALQHPTSAPIASLRLPSQADRLHSELLILPDGQILVHNLTAAFADLLKALNPNAEQIANRARRTPHHA